MVWWHIMPLDCDSVINTFIKRLAVLQVFFFVKYF